jgi:hypothetical protein
MVQVPILGELYSVTFETMPELGLCDFLECSIKLNADLKNHPDQLWRVLRHEIGHAFAYQSGLSDYMNAREQEMIAQLIGNLLVIFPEPDWLHLINAENPD